MTFDIRALIRDYLDETEMTDFREMAAELSGRLSAKQVRAALVEALPSLIQTINQQRRMNNSVLAGAAGVPVRSAKVAGIAAMHAAALRVLIHVGEGRNKQLGDCTYEDLLFAAEERREQARRNAAKAEQFEALAAKLRAAGVQHVADLPAAELAELGAAA